MKDTFLNSNGLTKGTIPPCKPCPFVNECRAFIKNKCPNDKYVMNTSYSCAFARGLSLDKEEEKEEKARKEAEEKRAHWFKNIDSLLKIVKHNNETCSDGWPCNIGRCTRCTLLEIQENGYWPEEYELEINLRESR